MYHNQMYPQPLYMNRMFVNPAHQYDPYCNCPCHHWDQHLYSSPNTSPVSEQPNYYPNNEMYVSPMQATPEYDPNKQMCVSPMQATPDYNLSNQMHVGPMNDNMLRNQNQYADPMSHPPQNDQRNHFRDHGGEPYIVNIEEAAERNNNFRTALWTGDYFQVTLMSIGVGEDIGLEVHPDTDQFLRIEEGRGFVQMGDAQDNLTFQRNVSQDDAIMVPAGMWHNLTNRGNSPLKLYTIYAPPEHPFGTVHRTKAEAMEDEH